jgi:hypothetical protein
VALFFFSYYFFSYRLSIKTRFNIALLFILLSKNIACLIVKEDISSLVQRLGVISTINLMPLILREYINFVANRYRVNLKAYAYMYKWLRGVAILKGLVYIVAAVLLQPFNLYIRFRIKALTISRLCL